MTIPAPNVIAFRNCMPARRMVQIFHSEFHLKPQLKPKEQQSKFSDRIENQAQ